jgi:hypothetical protein
VRDLLDAQRVTADERMIGRVDGVLRKLREAVRRAWRRWKLARSPLPIV